jgi:isoleucyl-tRNA synthetase
MYNFKEAEESILKFWKDKKIYEKSRKKNARGKAFYLMDGPPYATGHIHMGTALNKILKDIAMRSQRLQGKNIFDRAGYDTHGLPIEYQIEKELGFKNKKDIEKFGIKKFIEKCKDFATKYIDVMSSEFKNLGVWMDFKAPYLTLNSSYVEAIWDTFKEADKKNLLYLGKYPVHVCPRCETAVSYNEIEYARIEDTSIYVKFKLKDKNNYLLIWTTTPWTLPGNTGIMVNPDFDYAEVELDNKEKWIMAKDLVERIMSKFGSTHKIIRIFKGKEMEGWRYYNPLIEHLKLRLDKEKNYKIVLSRRYVNLEEGTGLVHSAPGHGKEDYEVGKEYNLDMPSPVDINGLMTEEAGKYAGKKARVVDLEIIKDLDEEGMLARIETYSHDYPLCWRCKEPLLMLSLPQWFFRISSIQEKLLKENEDTNWIPGWMKLRMKAWLQGLGDWPVSRKRYWGTPLPIWVCEKCKEKITIGSVKELERLSKKKIKEVHKPEIDSVFIRCKKCSGIMKRVEDVLDVWFDAGVSSWAALNYPGENKLFKKFWPADLNVEGKDQIRGWWNSQLILSEIRFGKKPFENVSVHGLVLDLGKRKMSKSLGNIVSPNDIIEKFGRDYMRYYFAKTSKGEDFAFNEKEFLSIGEFFRVLINISNFINQLGKMKGKIKVEDKWILSRFNSLVKACGEDYNKFRFPDIVGKIENFLIFDLSKRYIQIIRERQDEVYEIMNKIRINLLKLLAPICPFITEKIWQELKAGKLVKEESIHLTSFPKPGKIDKKLEDEFELIRKIIELGLAERDKAKIGLKWPLGKAIIFSEKKLNKELEEIIARQLNVRKIEVVKGKKIKVELDTKMTSELEAEGYAREVARKIQDERKKAGLVKKDLIELVVVADDNLLEMLKMQEKFLKERVNAKKILLTTEKERFKNIIEFKIKEKRLGVTLKRV